MRSNGWAVRLLGAIAERFPLENAYGVLRRFLWLETDSAYKSAVEAISRKRAALKNIAEGEQIDDFTKAEPVKKVEEIRHVGIDEEGWAARVRALSAVFAGYPDVKASGVELSATETAHYFVNSEGTEVRIADRLIYLLARAEAQAPDGMVVRNAAIYQSLDFGLVEVQVVRDFFRPKGLVRHSAKVVLCVDSRASRDLSHGASGSAALRLRCS